jgi:hypothetical protein
MPKQSVQGQDGPPNDLPISLGPLQHPEAGQERFGRWLRIASVVLAITGCSTSTPVGAEGAGSQVPQSIATASRIPGAETSEATAATTATAPTSETKTAPTATTPTVPEAKTAPTAPEVKTTPTGLHKKRYAALPKETLDELKKFFGGLHEIVEGTGLTDPTELPGEGIETTLAEREALSRARVEIVRRNSAGLWELICNGLFTRDGVVVTATHCLGIQPGEPMGGAILGMAVHDITGQLSNFPAAIRKEGKIIPVQKVFAGKQDGLSTDVAVLTPDSYELLPTEMGYKYEDRLKKLPVPGSSVYVVSTNGSSPNAVKATGQYLGKTEAFMGGGFFDVVGFKTGKGLQDPCLPGASGAAAVTAGSTLGPSSVRMSFQGANVTNEVLQRTIFEKNTGVNTADFDVLCAYAAADSPLKMYKLLREAALR